MMPENMLTCCFRFMRLAFWLTATVLGSGGIIATLASFNKPEASAHAIVFLLGAVGLLYARDATPK